MARFQTRFKQLLLTKSAHENRAISQREVASETKLSIPTISRWYRDDIDRLEPNSAAALMQYFGCTLDELVEVVE